uniref:Uncharacterized protein n=1 Tax=Lutzomyia longipalpis TaxID=7200 RepID=A0A3F2ZD80_LUTLO
MLSILETLGCLYWTQKFISLFDFKFSPQNRGKGIILQIASRIPLVFINLYAGFDLFVILTGKMYIAVATSITALAVSTLDLFLTKGGCVLATTYFAVQRKKHLKFIDDVANFEEKLCHFFGAEVFRKRKFLKRKFNFEAIIILFHDFTYNLILLTQIENVLILDAELIIWYICLISQATILDYLAFYIMGYINIFMNSLEMFNLKKVSKEKRIQIFYFLMDFIRIIDRINALFSIYLFAVMAHRVIEASSICFFLFIVISDVPMEYLYLLAFFIICCILWSWGDIYIMMRIGKVGETLNRKMDSVIRNMALFYNEQEERKDTQNCINLNIKHFLLRFLHKSNNINVGDININLNLVCKVLTVLASNLIVLIEFKTYEELSALLAKSNTKNVTLSGL